LSDVREFKGYNTANFMQKKFLDDDDEDST